MTAQGTGRMVLSFWILNLLNDFGWYQVNFSKAEALDNAGDAVRWQKGVARQVV